MKHLLKIFFLFAALFLFEAASAGTVTYVYTDPQGSPLAEADANGNITATFDYRPYGAQALGSTKNGPGYTGHVNDADSGLVYMQARYYDPEVARFVSIDPIGFRPADGFTFNRYLYALGNPVDRIDPDGRDSVGEMIDRNAQEAADQGSGIRTYAWAFAGTAWEWLGAEPVSQVADKGGAASSSDKIMAMVTIATLGKAEEAGNVLKEGEKAAEGLAKEIGILREAASGKGNFGLGSATREDAEKLGKAWVGEGYKLSSDGKALISKDGTKQFRLSYKPKLGKTQANFERKLPGQRSARWQSNAHLDMQD